VGANGWRIRGTYLESCNCDPICPCRRIGGVQGGRSTYGVCLGALSWQIETGSAGSTVLDGLRVVIASHYDDDEPGSPWSIFLYVDERADVAQREALEGIFLGRLPGDIEQHAPWLWKESSVLGTSAARIEIDHTGQRRWFRVRNHVEVRVSAPVAEQPVVTCVIPGHEREGQEVVVDVLRVDEQPPLAFEYHGNCGYASTFEYSDS
jgi:hypothetical protein